MRSTASIFLLMLIVFAMAVATRPIAGRAAGVDHRPDYDRSLNGR